MLSFLLKERELYSGEEDPHAARCGGFVVARAEMASTPWVTSVGTDFMDLTWERVHIDDKRFEMCIHL